MKEHSKLVRDNIPALLEANGSVVHVRTLTKDAEFIAALCANLHAVADHLREDSGIDELADALDIVRAIGAVRGYTPKQINVASAKQTQALGGFKNRIFLVSTEGSADAGPFEFIGSIESNKLTGQDVDAFLEEHGFGTD